jgi:hypothetical protein
MVLAAIAPPPPPHLCRLLMADAGTLSISRSNVPPAGAVAGRPPDAVAPRHFAPLSS